MDRVLRETTSVCPYCLKVIPALLIGGDADVRMEKQCPEHGPFSAIVWRGDAQSWLDWDHLNMWADRKDADPRPCPEKCGLCAEHVTNACFVVLEVTKRCNLLCPVCFADAGITEEKDTSLPELAFALESALRAEAKLPSLQISGGEPTVREDLPSIIALARSAGFEHVVLDTNGIRIGRDRGFLRSLKEAGLDTLYLQFDGLDDDVYRALRGRPLLNEKLNAIENCGLEGVGVVLVPTLAKGINFAQVGRLVDFAREHMPTVRGVLFQPISFFGRYPHELRERARITLPELTKAIEEQTSGALQVEDFPPTDMGRWDETHCGFTCFAVKSGDKLIPFTRFPSKAQADQIISSRTGQQSSGPLGMIKVYWKPAKKEQPASCCCASESDGSKDSLFISAMLFQDAWNVDACRLKKCCVHVAALDGRVIPFCAYNLTSESGRALYRGAAGRRTT